MGIALLSACVVFIGSSNDDVKHLEMTGVERIPDVHIEANTDKMTRAGIGTTQLAKSLIGFDTSKRTYKLSDIRNTILRGGDGKDYHVDNLVEINVVFSPLPR